MDAMTLLVAIRHYMNRADSITPNGDSLTAKDMLEFKNACSDSDFAQYRSEMESYGYTLKS